MTYAHELLLSCILDFEFHSDRLGENVHSRHEMVEVTSVMDYTKHVEALSTNVSDFIETEGYVYL